MRLSPLSALPATVENYVTAEWPTLAQYVRRVRGTDGNVYTRVYSPNQRHIGTVREMDGWITDDSYDYEVGISD